MVQVTLNGNVIADSDKTVVVEGNHYFPPEDVKKEFLTDSKTTTVCGWKGTASYYDISVNDQTVKDAAWYYHELTTARAKELKIEDYVAFYKSKVTIQ